MLKRKWLIVMSTLLVLLSTVTVAHAGSSGFPKTKEVPDGKGGFRIDVVDRPSNATPGADAQARAKQIPGPDHNSNVGPMTAGTNSTPPTTINVAIRPNNDPNAPIQSVQTVTFYDALGTSDYVQNVLPNEWVCSAWPAESLKTGAMAVKMYGWYHTINPRYPAAGADVDNTQNTQVYKPNTAYPSCTSAIRTLAHTGYRRNFASANPYIFETAYCAGFYSDDRSIPCDNYSVGDTVSQNGSHYWADQGKTYSWILDAYYIPPAWTTQEYFSY